MTLKEAAELYAALKDGKTLQRRDMRKRAYKLNRTLV